MTNLRRTIETAFAAMDAEVLANQTEWALGRKVALKEFMESAEYQEIRRDAWTLYPRMFNICGGKGWYNVVKGSEASIREFVAKNCKAIADKRNATVVAKLKKIGVTEIGEIEYTRTNDGFNGVFIFDGARIEIRTIIAGGYNVQCLHQRTLVYANGRRA